MRPTRRPFGTFLVAAAGVALILAACTGGSSQGGSTDQLESALEGSDLGISQASVTTRSDGLARVLSVIVAIDSDRISADQLRGVLEIAVDTAGEGRADQIDLSATEKDVRGELLPVWPALAEVGFEQRPSEDDTRFVESVDTVREVLKR